MSLSGLLPGNARAGIDYFAKQMGISSSVFASNSLKANLQRVTHSEDDDLPETLHKICQASHDSRNRRVVMHHLRACFSEMSGRRWRIIYGALVLLENLVKKSPPAVLSELANGFHFNVMQISSDFQCPEDERIQTLVREKANRLFTTLHQKIQASSGGALGQSCPGSESSRSLCFGMSNKESPFRSPAKQCTISKCFQQNAVSLLQNTPNPLNVHDGTRVAEEVQRHLIFPSLDCSAASCEDEGRGLLNSLGSECYHPTAVSQPETAQHTPDAHEGTRVGEEEEAETDHPLSSLNISAMICKDVGRNLSFNSLESENFQLATICPPQNARAPSDLDDQATLVYEVEGDKSGDPPFTTLKYSETDEGQEHFASLPVADRTVCVNMSPGSDSSTSSTVYVDMSTGDPYVSSEDDEIEFHFEGAHELLNQAALCTMQTRVPELCLKGESLAPHQGQSFIASKGDDNEAVVGMESEEAMSVVSVTGKSINAVIEATESKEDQFLPEASSELHLTGKSLDEQVIEQQKDQFLCEARFGLPTTGSSFMNQIQWLAPLFLWKLLSFAFLLAFPLLSAKWADLTIIPKDQEPIMISSSFALEVEGCIGQIDGATVMSSKGFASLLCGTFNGDFEEEEAEGVVESGDSSGKWYSQWWLVGSALPIAMAFKCLL